MTMADERAFWDDWNDLSPTEKLVLLRRWRERRMREKVVTLRDEDIKKLDRAIEYTELAEYLSHYPGNARSS